MRESAGEQESIMPRPRIWEPEDCVFPQDRLTLIQVLARKVPQGGMPEAWATGERPIRLTFTIALVRWDGETRLAYRYDGDENHPNGWPSSNSYPSWDILPRPLQPLMMPAIPMEFHQLVQDHFRRNQTLAVQSEAA